MTCFKVVLIVLLSVEIVICDLSFSRYNSNPHNEVSNQAVDSTSTSKVVEDEEVKKDKVNITVYYESRCPASIEFIVKELKPTVEKLSSHLNIRLIPYGFASTTDVLGSYEFSCHHGQAECNGNMLQACTLHAVKNRTEAIIFNACLMQHHNKVGDHIADYIPVLNWCGHKHRVLIHPIWECVKTTHGATLLKEYGDETNALEPDFVPYVVVDGTLNDDAREDFLSTVCEMLNPEPLVCAEDLE